jgi:hypothetical protein
MSAKKAGRGRPRCESIVVQIKLRLHPGEDDDLIAFFAGLPPYSRANSVKIAMRSGNLASGAPGDGVDEDDIADALERFLV